MITVGEATMRHFRLKVNLSKFFQDVRKFCWIFIDGTKIQQVTHIKQHISSMFNITEPFHLLLNDAEYLPPNEDVRILRENETILVVPGSGISNENADKIEVYSSCHMSTVVYAQDKDQKNEFEEFKAKRITSDKVFLPQNANTTTLSNALNNTQRTSINNTTADMTFYSMKNDTVIANIEEDDSKDNSITEGTQIEDISVTSLQGTQSSQDNAHTENTEDEMDSKSIDNNAKENANVTDFLVPRKRKRVRKRKPRIRSRSFVTSHSDNIDEKNPKKPKIIESYVIPSDKHIRFNTEDNENDIAKKIVQEVSRNESSNSVRKDVKDFPSRESGLSTLLALRQCSTPITYENTKMKKVFKVEKLSNNEEKSNAFDTIKVENVSTEKNLIDTSASKTISTESLNKENNLNLEDCPVMTRKPKVEDIIAFKTLKIGTDFTPQISNFITARVMDVCPESLNYTLKLNTGKSEIQIPFGKFSISEDESENDTTACILNYSQIIEPRLLHST